MPFAFLIIGILFIVVGFQDTYKQFGAQVVSDFSGQNSFLWYMVAIGSVGAIGYIKPLETPSRVFLALIIIALFIGAVNKGGFFTNLQSGINSGDSASVNPIGTSLQSANSSGGSSGGSSLSSASSDISTAVSVASLLAGG